MLVDDRWFGATGIGRFAKEIIKRAPSDVSVEYLSKEWSIKNPISPLLLGYEINKRAPDLFWTPGFMPPISCKCPYIVTVHDLIHLIYGSQIQVLYYNYVIRPMLKKAAYILTVSEYSRRHILDWSKLPPEKVITVYNAVSHGYKKEGDKYSPGYKYILYAGNKRKHKNLQRLIIAFSRAELPDQMRLVITGESTQDLTKLADKLNILNRLVFIGFVAEENMASLYRGAVAVILVSLCEGFGIPLIEGMACGVPVLASNTSALPEVSGGASYLVDPYNVQEIRAGIEKIVNDKALRKELISRGDLRSQEFSWDTTADKVWNLFSSISHI